MPYLSKTLSITVLVWSVLRNYNKKKNIKYLSNPNLYYCIQQNLKNYHTLNNNNINIFCPNTLDRISIILLIYPTKYGFSAWGITAQNRTLYRANTDNQTSDFLSIVSRKKTQSLSVFLYTVSCLKIS